MMNADLSRIINSDEIQSVLKQTVKSVDVLPVKTNLLRNRAAKIALNPYHTTAQSRKESKSSIC